MVAVPPPREAGHYRVALVCLGNICRSPIADVVLRDRVAAAGLDGRVTVVSAGTGDWHIGNPMDERAAVLLTSKGYDADTTSAHRAQQVRPAWLTECDLLLAMDRQNLRDLRSLARGPLDAERIRLFGDFDPVTPGAEVPDPYYGGDDGFRSVLAMVERTSDALVRELAACD